MSIEAVKQFSNKADTDKALQSKLDAIPKIGSREWEIAQIVKIAADAGFQFTLQDYDSFVKEEMVRKDAAKQFLRKANKDPKLQAKVKAIPTGTAWDNVLTEVVKIAAEAGFKFTPRDYDGAINELQMMKSAEVELSEEDLELVAGGGSSGFMTQSIAAASMTTA